jgi:hypothetical protein
MKTGRQGLFKDSFKTATPQNSRRIRPILEYSQKGGGFGLSAKAFGHLRIYSRQLSAVEVTLYSSGSAEQF